MRLKVLINLTQRKMANTVAPETTREYELMVILPPDLTDPELKAKVQELKTALTQHGGKVLNHEVTPLRDFAYRIKKYDNGYYVTFHFSFSTEFINELEKMVRIEMGVVRHLLLICPKNYEFKGLQEYAQEADAMRLKEMEEKKAKDQADMDRRNRPAARPAPRAEKPEMDKGPVPASKPVVKEEVKVEKAPVMKTEPKPSLDKVDEQLKALLDNPDIQI